MNPTTSSNDLFSSAEHSVTFLESSLSLHTLLTGDKER